MLEVAVKNIIPLSSDEDKVKFLQEAAIMGQFLHPNVVKLYGVVTMGEPVSGGWERGREGGREGEGGGRVGGREGGGRTLWGSSCTPMW